MRVAQCVTQHDVGRAPTSCALHVQETRKEAIASTLQARAVHRHRGGFTKNRGPPKNSRIPLE